MTIMFVTYLIIELGILVNLESKNFVVLMLINCKAVAKWCSDHLCVLLPAVLVNWWARCVMSHEFITVGLFSIK